MVDVLGRGLNKRIFDRYRDHPLCALSHGNMSAVSSFNHSARDAVSECLNGDRTK